MTKNAPIRPQPVQSLVNVINPLLVAFVNQADNANQRGRNASLKSKQAPADSSPTVNRRLRHRPHLPDPAT
jgi:hypothetical protein